MFIAGDQFGEIRIQSCLYLVYLLLNWKIAAYTANPNEAIAIEDVWHIH